MSEKENHDPEDTRPTPSQGREARRGEDLEPSWDSYSLEVLHALDD
jgi:hypothetical protein